MDLRRHRTPHYPVLFDYGSGSGNPPTDPSERVSLCRVCYCENAGECARLLGRAPKTADFYPCYCCCHSDPPQDPPVLLTCRDLWPCREQAAEQRTGWRHNAQAHKGKLNIDKLVRFFNECERLGHFITRRGRLRVNFSSACWLPECVTDIMRRQHVHVADGALVLLDPRSVGGIFCIIFESGNYLLHCRRPSSVHSQLSLLQDVITDLISLQSNRTVYVPNAALELVRRQTRGLGRSCRAPPSLLRSLHMRNDTPESMVSIRPDCGGGNPLYSPTMAFSFYLPSSTSSSVGSVSSDRTVDSSSSSSSASSVGEREEEGGGDSPTEDQ